MLRIAKVTACGRSLRLGVNEAIELSFLCVIFCVQATPASCYCVPLVPSTYHHHGARDRDLFFSFCADTLFHPVTSYHITKRHSTSSHITSRNTNKNQSNRADTATHGAAGSNNAQRSALPPYLRNAIKGTGSKRAGKVYREKKVNPQVSRNTTE